MSFLVWTTYTGPEMQELPEFRQKNYTFRGAGSNQIQVDKPHQYVMSRSQNTNFTDKLCLDVAKTSLSSVIIAMYHEHLPSVAYRALHTIEGNPRGESWEISCALEDRRHVSMLNWSKRHKPDAIHLRCCELALIVNSGFCCALPNFREAALFQNLLPTR